MSAVRSADARRGAGELERIGDARAGAHEAAGAPAEACLQLVKKLPFGSGKQTHRVLGRHRPHDGEAAVVQGQQRERT